METVSGGEGSGEESQIGSTGLGEEEEEAKDRASTEDMHPIGKRAAEDIEMADIGMQPRRGNATVTPPVIPPVTNKQAVLHEAATPAGKPYPAKHI